MKKQNKTETHTENIQIPITPDLKRKIKSYCKLSKTSQNKFIESLINNFFEYKILSNDFIKLDKPFYFNLNEYDIFSIIFTISLPCIITNSTNTTQ